MEVGKVGFREGMYMASTDEIHITIHGKGGHAAMPADYINPLVSAAQLINRVMSQISTFIDEEGLSRSQENTIPTVIAFGKIEGKGATNVIPDQVSLAGTIRTMNEEWRKEIKNRLRNICKEIEQEQKVKIDLNIMDGYPFLSNHVQLTQQCKQAAIEYLGANQVEELPLRMTAEDFAYITQMVPSCFYRLGTGNKAKGITSGVHTATFDIDETVFEISGGLMAWMAIKQLG
jgi:amidohydrolase